MEGGGNNINNNNNNNSSCMMMENGLYPMLMIPPLSHHQLNHSNIHHNNNNNKHQHQLCGGGGGCGGGCGGGGGGGGCYDLMDVENQTHNLNTNESNNSFGSIKAKIVAHPHYPRLLSAYVNCQKVGAPPEVVAKLEEAEAMAVDQGGGRGGGGMVAAGYIGEDPALDQFMEAYCEMLTKYEQELTKPFKEAMLFLSRIECQFKALTLSSSSDSRSSGE